MMRGFTIALSGVSSLVLLSPAPWYLCEGDVVNCRSVRVRMSKTNN